MSAANSGARPARRRWMLGVLTAGISLVIALAGAEAVLRILDIAPVAGLATVSQREFTRVPGLFSPGQRVLDRDQPSLPYLVTIDSLGFRGLGELSRTKPPGELRVLMLGDSFTFGYLVDDEETLPARVEENLRSRCGAPLRVINAGVGGSSIETAAPMAERALDLSPDVVVLTFTENDVTDLAAPMWDQLAQNRRAKSRFPMAVIYPAVRETALWNLLLKARATWRARQTVSTPVVQGTDNAARRDSVLVDLRTQYAERLEALRRRLSDAGIALVFAIYPSHLTVYQHRDEQVKWVEHLARSLGIPTVNLTESLVRDGRPQDKLYLLPLDGHPSPSGYTVVAPSIAEVVSSTAPFRQRCTAAVAPH